MQVACIIYVVMQGDHNICVALLLMALLDAENVQLYYVSGHVRQSPPLQLQMAATA